MSDRIDRALESGAPEHDDLAVRRARVRAAMQGPTVAKALSQRGALGKLRAAACFKKALEAVHWSEADAALHLGVDKSAVDAFLHCGAQPSWYVHELPRVAYLAYQDAMLDDVPPPSGRTGTHG